MDPGSLDFLNILGLAPEGAECLRGRGGSSSPSSGGSTSVVSTGGGGALAFDWGTVPADLLTQLQDYYGQQQAWIQAMEALGDDQEQAASADEPNSRGLRELPAVIENAPLVPVLLGALATGGVSVPVALGGLLAQVGLSVADAVLRQAFDRLDPNSPANQMKALIEAIQDLKYNDEVVDFGSVRIHHKGKVIEY